MSEHLVNDPTDLVNDPVALVNDGAPGVPGAPTIGTATAADRQATVTFTPPINDGGSPITSYTATSTPGGLTATGPGSPLTVTGLTNGTSYTFKVKATNSVGDGPESAASNAVTPSSYLLKCWVEIDSSLIPKAHGAVANWTRITHGNDSPPANGIIGFYIDRGQRDRYGPCEPGVVTITTDNTNGHHDPDNPLSGAANPYAGLLTQGRQFRLRQTRNDGAGDQTVCSGTIDNVEALDNDLRPITQFTCSDVIASAGMAMTPPSLIEYELDRGVRYPRPIYVWPLREDVTAVDVQFMDTHSGYSATAPTGPPVAAGSSLVPYSDIQGLSAQGGQALGSFIPGLSTSAPIPPPPWSFMIMTMVEEDGFAELIGTPEFYKHLSPLGLTITATLSRDRTAVATVQTIAGEGPESTAAAEGTMELDDGSPHMIGMSDSGSQLSLYVDGAGVAGQLHGPLRAPPGPLRFGGGTGCHYALFCVWSVLVTVGAGHWQAMWADVMRPWAGDTISTRIPKLIDVVMPGAARSIASAGNLCLPVTMNGRPLLDLLRRLTEADLGRLWADRADTLQFNPDSATAGAAIRNYGGPLTPVYNVQRSKAQPVTHVVIENEAGTRVEYQDHAARDRIGPHRLDITDCPLRDPSAMRGLAQGIVNTRSADTGMYTSSFDIHANNPHIGFDDTLALEPYDRVALTHWSRWRGSYVEELQIIGFTHDAQLEDGRSMVTTVRTRPA